MALVMKLILILTSLMVVVLGVMLLILISSLEISKISFLGESKIRFILRNHQENIRDYKCLPETKHNKHKITQQPTTKQKKVSCTLWESFGVFVFLCFCVFVVFVWVVWRLFLSVPEFSCELILTLPVRSAVSVHPKSDSLFVRTRELYHRTLSTGNCLQRPLGGCEMDNTKNQKKTKEQNTTTTKCFWQSIEKFCFWFCCACSFFVCVLFFVSTCSRVLL